MVRLYGETTSNRGLNLNPGNCSAPIRMVATPSAFYEAWSLAIQPIAHRRTHGGSLLLWDLSIQKKLTE